MNSGAISELPVSDSRCGAVAGVVGSAGPLAGDDDEVVAAPPLQAAKPSTAARPATVMTRGPRPGRRPGGGCAPSASTDNVPSLVLDRSGEGTTAHAFAH